MDKLINHIFKEWAAIKSAPLAFICVALLSVAITFLASDWFYSGRIEGFKEADARKSDQMADQQSQLSNFQNLFPGRTVEEVAKRLENLEKKTAAPKVEEISRIETKNQDGTYTLTITAKIVSQIVTPGRFTIIAAAYGLLELKIKEDGFSKTGNGTDKDGRKILLVSTNPPFGQFDIEVRMEKPTEILINYGF
ncbi:MAG: hypothetical protein V1721_09155 [Pseudomonadota bacterium]